MSRFYKKVLYGRRVFQANSFRCVHQTRKSTSNAESEELYRKLASTWWDKNGPSRALHTMNFLRVPLICDGLKRSGLVSPHAADGPLPLEGLHILDIGCGGGILSEPLATLGASVTGLDPIQDMIDVATCHSSQNPVIKDRLKFVCGTTEELDVETKYDAVVASEVIEHVKNLDTFLNSCVGLVKEGGSLFFTSINRTWASFLFAIIAAEWIFHLIPRGTHSWEKFVPPAELQSSLENNGCGVRLIHGMCYNPLTHNWSWTSEKSIGYALHAIKPSSQNEHENKH